ncbi:galactose oxidase [Russula emetica]|nr:galactose oxidase [Russula emetica]
MVCPCSPIRTVAVTISPILSCVDRDCDCRQRIIPLWRLCTRFCKQRSVPSPRVAHGAALTSTNFLIWGGMTNFSDQNVLNQRHGQDDSLYLLNLVSREWTRVVVNGPGPSGRSYHTVTLIGSKLFIFGGKIGRTTLNDMWAFDLNTLKSQPFWESYEPTPGNEKPPPRASHVSVATEDRIIIFGGSDSRHDYNDTWSFDISTRKWTELQCTGSIPSPRSGHAAVLIDDVMYVFGGFTMDKTYLDDLIALQLSTQRWFKFHNVGPNPHRRSCHTMASDGTRVFLLGGWPKGAQTDEISLIHVLDTSINRP